MKVSRAWIKTILWYLTQGIIRFWTRSWSYQNIRRYLFIRMLFWTELIIREDFRRISCIRRFVKPRQVIAKPRIGKMTPMLNICSTTKISGRITLACIWQQCCSCFWFLRVWDGYIKETLGGTWTNRWRYKSAMQLLNISL